MGPISEHLINHNFHVRLGGQVVAEADPTHHKYTSKTNLYFFLKAEVPYNI